MIPTADNSCSAKVIERAHGYQSVYRIDGEIEPALVTLGWDPGDQMYEDSVGTLCLHSDEGGNTGFETIIAISLSAEETIRLARILLGATGD